MQNICWWLCLSCIICWSARNHFGTRSGKLSIWVICQCVGHIMSSKSCKTHISKRKSLLLRRSTTRSLISFSTHLEKMVMRMLGQEFVVKTLFKQSKTWKKCFINASTQSLRDALDGGSQKLRWSHSRIASTITTLTQPTSSFAMSFTSQCRTWAILKTNTR